MTQYAKQGQTYTLTEINSLTLRDSPFLRVNICGELYPVQTSHLEEGELLAMPGWADSKWTYQRETDEWIPLFRFAGTQEEQEALVDYAPDPSEFNDYIVSPKGNISPHAEPR